VPANDGHPEIKAYSTMNYNPDDNAFGYPMFLHAFERMKSTTDKANHFAALVPEEWLPWITHCGLLPDIFTVGEKLIDQVYPI
jgi:hypothetical protein